MHLHVHQKEEIPQCSGSAAIVMPNPVTICLWSVQISEHPTTLTPPDNSVSIKWTTFQQHRLSQHSKHPSSTMPVTLLFWEEPPKVHSIMQALHPSIILQIDHPHLKSEVLATSIKIQQAAVPIILLFKVVLLTITVRWGQVVDWAILQTIHLHRWILPVGNLRRRKRMITTRTRYEVIYHLNQYTYHNNKMESILGSIIICFVGVGSVCY